MAKLTVYGTDTNTLDAVGTAVVHAENQYVALDIHSKRWRARGEGAVLLMDVDEAQALLDQLKKVLL